MVNSISGGNNKINKIFEQQKIEEEKTVDKSSEQENTQSLTPYNNAYVTPFIKVNKTPYTKNEREFIDYRDKFCEVLSTVNTEYNKANWEFYINSTPENANILNIMCSEYEKVFSDEEAYAKFKEFNEKGIKDPHLQEHMNELMSNFESVLGCDNAEEALGVETSPAAEGEVTNGQRVTVDEISQIFNGFKPEIDGKQVTEKEISDILKNENDVEIRKKAYYAQFQSGDAIADKMIQLVKQRNEEAKAYGYNNYYEMQLEQYGTSEEKLFKLLDDLDAKSDAIYRKVSAQDDEEVCKKFNIRAEEIKPYHFGLQTSESINKQADEYFTTENLVPTANKMYNKMGWQLDKMPIEMDLFPRDNKNGHGFCFQIEAGKDARILANLYDDRNSMETLLHESGHAVYDIGLPTSLPFFDRNPASSVMTESVAMLMETLPEREGAYTELVGMPKELNDKLEKDRVEGLSNFVKSYIFYSQFEKQLYENPDQDIPKLWYDLKQKYKGINPPEEMHNEWATVPHFLTHPGYLQNYLRAEVMAAQIYDAAHEKLGCNLSETKETAKFFQENIFKYGSSKSEDEIMKIATGKELDAEAFCKQLDKLENA